MNRNLPIVLLIVLLSLNTSSTFAQMYISEVLYGPGGTDTPHEFFEIRGTASSTIAANTYLVFIEGDDSDPGDVNMAFDLSGLSFGTNGYLVFTMEGNSFTTTSGATEVESSDLVGTGWQGVSEVVGSATEIEGLSTTILLVTSTSSISDSDDLDSDNDGEIDITGWTIHDGIAILDDDDTNEYGYADLIYSQNAAGTISPSGSTVLAIDFEGGYVSRIGESTGSTNNDWFCATTSTLDINSSSTDQAFSDESISEVGGPSYDFTAVTYNGSFSPSTPDKTNDLTISSSLSTTDDLACHNLTINSGQTLTLQDGGSIKVYGSLTVNGTLMVESGGTLWTFDGKDADAITAERNTTYSDGRYSFVGTPVNTDASITGSDLGSISYSYNETTGYDSDDGLSRWENASSTQLEVGVGYAQAFQETITFTGVPNDGTITVDGLTHTTTGTSTSTDRGFNLLSNPYPSAIEADEFLTENTDIDGAIYLWDDDDSDVERGTNSDYITWNNIGDVAGPNSGRVFQGQIRSMQGFFVRVTNSGSASVNFLEDMRGTGDNSDGRFFRVEEEAPLNLKVSLETKDGELYNETLIGLREEATVGKDRMYDAMKLRGNNNLQLYSLLEGEKYAIQGLPIYNGVSAELAFDFHHTSNDLVLKVQEISGLEDGMTFSLTDHLTGQSYDLSEISSFNIFAEYGSDVNRFSISYVSRAEFTNLQEVSSLTYQITEGVLQILSGNKHASMDYAIYDISGRVFSKFSGATFENGAFNIPIHELSGLYIIKMKFDDENPVSLKFKF
ncbi:MAG: T9SS type A sorting domain-containing protein [bacterium]|nr:T9SS type A sorting domain-containing protein [bacterium]